MVPNQSPYREPPNKGWHYFLTTLLTTAFVTVLISSMLMFYGSWKVYSLLQVERQRLQLNQTQWQQLNQAERAAAAAEYHHCLHVLPDVANDSFFYPRAQLLQEQCTRPLGENSLAQAEDLATAGELKLAIAAANQIEEGPLYPESQQQIKLWSLRIIDFATKHYASEDEQLSSAINMLRAIPKGTPVYADSQALIEQWQQEWANNERYLNSANLALKLGDLEEAARAAEKISSHLFWAERRSQVQIDIQQQEQVFRQRVLRAERSVAAGNLTEAAAIAQQLPDYEPWIRKKQDLLEQVRIHKQDMNRLVFASALVAALFVCVVVKPASAKK